MELAKRLKHLRKKRNLKITDCAETIGVSPSTYREWEQGRSINGEPYQKIAETLGVSVSELLGTSREQLALQLDEIEEKAAELLHLVNSIRSGL